MAPINVATEPKIISKTIPPPIILAITHPMKSPGMAAGVNKGSVQAELIETTWGL